jgi:hypothetical protein
MTNTYTRGWGGRTKYSAGATYSTEPWQQETPHRVNKIVHNNKKSLCTVQITYMPQLETIPVQHVYVVPASVTQRRLICSVTKIARP